MNIFVILIMGVMLATYQYFTQKRSSDIVLNKDELRLQAELTCMKQYHDYAASQNEAYKTEVPNFKGTGAGQVNYVCQGADGIQSSKYCLDSSGNIADCLGTSIKEHCVSTTKQKKFSKDEKYLKTQILKSGVSFINGGKIKGKSVKSVNVGASNPGTGEETILIGLISCVDAEKIAAQNKMEKNNCKEGEYPIVNPDGSIGCEKITDITPCTSHEKEVETTTLALCSSSIEATGECSTQLISGKYCVPNSAARPTCRQEGQSVVWNRQLRFYVCDSAENYCSGNGTMLIRDDKNQTALTGTKTIEKAFTPQYNSSNSSFVCYPKADLYTKTCKDLVSASTEYAFLGVENLSTSAKANASQVQPVCRLSARKNSNAVENCTPCETTEFDPLNNKWKCKAYPTFAELKGKTDLINQLRGAAGKTEKGLKGCFTGCEDYMDLIKQGQRNGPGWGLVYNSSSRMWTCFKCQLPNTTYNNRCSCPGNKCVKGNIPSNCSQTAPGKCVPYQCSTEYQVLIDGTCYTKWCNKNTLPANVSIGQPMSSSCPVEAPWMVYNELKTCVYCMRPPPERLE